MSNIASSPVPTIDLLNDLLRVLCRSLPMYLQYAKPWSQGDRPEVHEALGRLVANQRLYARKVAAMIADRGGRPESGSFPTEFTSLNDAGLEFVLGRIIARQRCENEALRSCAAELSGETEARALAEEVLGNAQGHLDVLNGMQKDPRMANDETQMTKE
jgi:hypothetical protein